MIRYAITNSRAHRDPGVLLRRIAEIAAGIDYLQIREPGLNGRDLATFTRDVMTIAPSSVQLLTNDRADIAAALGIGLHLRPHSIAPDRVRVLLPIAASVSVACHSVDDVARASDEGADLVLLAPIFESPGKGAPLGLDVLGRAVKVSSVPVIALGGITAECIPCVRDAGASGFAAIRYFFPER